MNRRPRRRFGFGELLETRHCLSTATFVAHEIDRSADFVFENVDLADIDADGDRDLLVSVFSPVQSGVAWYANTDGRAAFADLEFIVEDPVPEFPFELATSDLDGDGNVDVIRGTGGQDQLIWHRNSDGGLDPAQAIISDPLRLVSDIAAVDMDADGDLDLLASSSSSVLPTVAFQRMTWHENTDGKGTFADERVIIDGNSQFALAFDADCDGDMDALSGVDQPTAPSQIRWHENLNGSGTQWESHAIVSDHGESAALFDSDQDGDLDIVVATSNDSEEGILHIVNAGCSGQGFSFSVEQLLRPRAVSNGFVPGGLLSSDIDGDSDIDILVVRDAVVGQTPVQRIDLLENVGGRFREPVSQITIHLPKFTPIFTDWVISDVDGDGDPDIVVSTGDSLRWYENRLVGDANDDGVFDSSDLIAVFQSGKYDDDIKGNATFAEGDWNDDGDFDSSDLVLAFQGGHYAGFLAPLKVVDRALVELVHDDGAGVFVA